MFKKKLTLTATTCRTMEELRLALEVWTGSNIRFKHIEFEKTLDTSHSGHGAFFVGDSEEPTELLFINDRGKESFFDLRIGETWFVARFDSPRQVRITEHNGDPDWKWTVGTSKDNRHEEPPHILPPVEP